MRSCTYLPLVGTGREEDDRVMFSVHCSRHGGSVLLPEHHIESLRNTVAGIEVAWVCYCGHHGSFTSGPRAERGAAIA